MVKLLVLRSDLDEAFLLRENCEVGFYCVFPHVIRRKRNNFVGKAICLIHLMDCQIGYTKEYPRIISN